MHTHRRLTFAQLTARMAQVAAEHGLEFTPLSGRVLESTPRYRHANEGLVASTQTAPTYTCRECGATLRLEDYPVLAERDGKIHAACRDCARLALGLS